MKKKIFIKTRKFVIYVEKNFVLIKMIKNFKKWKKSEITVITGKYRRAAHSVCNLRYHAFKEIPVAFHNGSTYDYHFIIKELARKFKGYFHCLVEITEKLLSLYLLKKFLIVIIMIMIVIVIVILKRKLKKSCTD